VSPFGVVMVTEAPSLFPWHAAYASGGGFMRPPRFRETAPEFSVEAHAGAGISMASAINATIKSLCLFFIVLSFLNQHQRMAPFAGGFRPPFTGMFLYMPPCTVIITTARYSPPNLPSKSS
jgi:hypothetical protein